MVVDCTCEGKDMSGGFILMWKSNFDVRVQSFSLNHIDVDIIEQVQARDGVQQVHKSILKPQG